MVRLPSKAFRRPLVPIDRGFDFGDSSLACKYGSVDTLMNLTDGEQIPELCRSFPLSDAYDLEETVLGQGGFGTVRRAWNKIDGTLRAVKAVPRKSIRFENMAKNEARILNSLDHARICKLMHVFEDLGHIHLVLEFATGHELYEEVAQRQAVEESRASSIIRQVLEALQYCHDPQRAIIHRDVKLENIMVSDVGPSGCVDVKVIDWGLATVCLDRVQTVRVGTACYLAPEVAREAVYSRSSDMWSVGVVLHALLTGGDFPNQCSQLDLSTSDVFNSSRGLAITAPAECLLNGLLKYVPSERLSATDALEHQWTKSCSHVEQFISYQQKTVVSVAQVDQTTLSEDCPGSFHDSENLADVTPSTDCSGSWPSVANSFGISATSGDFSLDLGSSCGDFEVYVDSPEVDASTCGLVSGPHVALKEDTTYANCDAVETEKGITWRSDMLLHKGDTMVTFERKENLVPETGRSCKLSVKALSRRHNALPKLTCAGNAIHSRLMDPLPSSNRLASFR